MIFRVLFLLALAVLANLFNANAEGLADVNQQGLVSTYQKADFARLIESIFKNGKDGKFGANLAPVIGLQDEAPTKDVETTISRSKNALEKKGCYVVIDSDKPTCAYIVKYTLSGKDSSTNYYRVTLDGQLEKAVLAQGKRDEKGKPIRGSGVKFDQDIESPAIQDAFKTEMTYWLEDWLKKEKKADKKVEVTKPIKTASL